MMQRKMDEMMSANDELLQSLNEHHQQELQFLLNQQRGLQSDVAFLHQENQRLHLQAVQFSAENDQLREAHLHEITELMNARVQPQSVQENQDESNQSAAPSSESLVIELESTLQPSAVLLSDAEI
jgi:TolA-binding protein